MPGMGPPPDNPTEATARELAEVSRDLKNLQDRQVELVLKALDEGGSTRRVGFYAGRNETWVRRVMLKHASPALRKKISARESSKKERQDYWPFKSKAEYDAFMSKPKRKS